MGSLVPPQKMWGYTVRSRHLRTVRRAGSRAGPRCSGGVAGTVRRPEEEDRAKENHWSDAGHPAAVLLAPLGVRADAEADDWKTAMENRMRVLEDQLAASQVTIKEQNQLLRSQGTPAVGQGAALPGFLNGLEIGGHITASYVYNFGNPDTNDNQQPLNAFNRNHNTFEFDAAKIELGKPAAEPGSAGFQLDLVYGRNNSIVCGLDDVLDSLDSDYDPNDPNNVSFRSVDIDSGMSVCVQQAYVSYNYNDVVLQFGKWETLMGVDLIDSPYNNHIQHGLGFVYGQPTLHNGLLAQGNLSEEIGWAAAVVNGFDNMTDSGDNKGVLGQLTYGGDPMELAFTVFVGSEGIRQRTSNGNYIGDNNNRTQIYDLTGKFAAGPDTDLWVNIDYGRNEHEPGIVDGPFMDDKPDSDTEWWSFAGGVKQALNEQMSIALRGEYFMDDGGVRLGMAQDVAPSAIGDVDVVSATATLAYQLTQNLMARVEYRRIWWDSDPDTDIFANENDVTGSPGDNDQDVGIVEVSYVFD